MSDFVKAAAFIENHYQTYPFEKLVEKEFTLSQIDEAFQVCQRREASAGWC